MRRFLSLLVCALHLATASFTQTKPPVIYRNLVMEGGGIRGIAYGGALAELEKQGVLAGIRRVGGTSAGAIQAALLAVGYSPAEIITVVNEMPVQRLNDGRLMFFGAALGLSNSTAGTAATSLPASWASWWPAKPARPTSPWASCTRWRRKAKAATCTPPAPT
ncbi:patatin-like phospholipase family protein [Hymenobacter cellulosilyticus]|uniref:Patatin-like phospholipase family protein n=1 Tax=Hymenobacter cellulosilyticus TaxID=2932248 RepID=A0A8T9Q987_9BACT|nr:patatin-like phospholipase family protein [Hymenobacter cellulosilyticus]UOQ72961.1 patatin-like phospholipase family protein [Hymenobacter cellulosilyticus]